MRNFDRYMNVSESAYAKIFDLKYLTHTAVKSSIIPLVLLTTYVLFCSWIGPAFMKNRRPFYLKIWIFVYDVCLVAVNIYLGFKIGSYCLTFNWGFHCPKSIESLALYGLKRFYDDIAVLYLYMSKYIDLIDTVFFVLTKKNRHISFLHIFHHACMPLLIYCILRFDPTGHYWLFVVTLNSCIHVIMYSYYGLTSIGFHWLRQFKRYLTLFQIIQFVARLTYISFLHYHGCILEFIFLIPGFIFIFLLLLLFINFYWQSYVKVKQL